jgi:hypothetical protein
MLTAEDKLILERVIERVPQFKDFLQFRLQEILSGLPSVTPDKVQVIQGRCLELQELLALLQHVSGK